MRRLSKAIQHPVETHDETQDDPETEFKRRAVAVQIMSKHIDREVKEISSSGDERCGSLFSCFFRRSKRQSSSSSSFEKRVFGTAVKATPAETKLSEVISQLQTLLEEQELKVKKARAHAQLAYKPGCDAKQNKEALQALKRVKQLEKQMEGMQGQLAMVERQRDTLEESQMQKKLVAALNQSAKVMKANGTLVKQAEQVADNAVELFDQNEDIANALSQINDEGDEDELLEELAQMDAEGTAIEVALELPEQPTPAISSTELPSAPKNKISQRKLEKTALLAAA